MESKKRNEREIRLCDIEFREAPDGQAADKQDEEFYELVGKPIVFGKKTKLGRNPFTDEEVYEVMEPECFDGADVSDVVFNVNHGDGNHATARTRNGTLALVKKGDGVECLVKLDKNNPRCVQTYIDVKSGLLDRMSFAFTIKEESYDKEEKCYHVRKLGKIYDVSAVEHPAYEDTSISERRMESAVAERSRAEALKLEADKDVLLRKLERYL